MIDAGLGHVQLCHRLVSILDGCAAFLYGPLILVGADNLGAAHNGLSVKLHSIGYNALSRFFNFYGQPARRVVLVTVISPPFPVTGTTTFFRLAFRGGKGSGVMPDWI